MENMPQTPNVKKYINLNNSLLTCYDGEFCRAVWPLCRNCHIMADKLALDLALRGIDPPGTIAELKRMLFPDPF